MTYVLETLQTLAILYLAGASIKNSKAIVIVCGLIEKLALALDDRS